ncbi:DUF3099 domain-containing protein [Corynebacterium caspium]|uniref:DUF3099 domain-containing protein n=1 Tax=Corynebacterium caspium TaxID=234828 RepID=UPI00037F14AA|nr:DUF3099 domain-containing protein [Corynebacterium caspium]WKD59143.1 hypothetical protein CCASP_03695 [Corynebacterium caspium DSM 44850]
MRQRQAELITSKQRSASQNRQHRERMYALLQGVRIPLIALGFVAFAVWHAWWLTLILIIISIPLPWVAVVIANGRGEPRDKRTPQVYKPAMWRATAAENASLSAVENPQLPPAVIPIIED